MIFNFLKRKKQVVELGIKLEKDLEYYDNILKSNGLLNDFTVTTRDLYYSNKKLDGLSENEMKNSCIRLRSYDNMVISIL